MFRTQLPSMPPSIQGNLPSFHTLQHRPPTSCHFEEAGAYQQKSFGHSQTSAVPSNLGLRTPPVEMTGVNTNPLLAPTLGGSQYKSVPLLASNAGAHHTNLSTVANPNYATKFQHHHPSFHATSDQHTASDRYNPNTQRPSYRRTSSDGNSIASYLQIPKSITQSEGSLAEFAAQVSYQNSLDSLNKLADFIRSLAYSGLRARRSSQRLRHQEIHLRQSPHLCQRQYPPWAFENGSPLFCRRLKSRRT